MIRIMQIQYSEWNVFHESPRCRYVFCKRRKAMKIRNILVNHEHCLSDRACLQACLYQGLPLKRVYIKKFLWKAQLHKSSWLYQWIRITVLEEARVLGFLIFQLHSACQRSSLPTTNGTPNSIASSPYSPISSHLTSGWVKRCSLLSMTMPLRHLLKPSQLLSSKQSNHPRNLSTQPFKLSLRYGHSLAKFKSTSRRTTIRSFTYSRSDS